MNRLKIACQILGGSYPDQKRKDVHINTFLQTVFEEQPPHSPELISLDFCIRRQIPLCIQLLTTKKMHFTHSFLMSVKPFTTDSELDLHESVHRDIIMKITNKMQLYRLIYYSESAVHVSGNVFAHHQENLAVFTASGNIHQCCCRLVSWMSWNFESWRQCMVRSIHACIMIRYIY
jgi:hypothetical protein